MKKEKEKLETKQVDNGEVGSDRSDNDLRSGKKRNHEHSDDSERSLSKSK